MQNTLLNLQKIDIAQERMEDPRLEPVILEVWIDKLAWLESCVLVDPFGDSELSIWKRC